MNLILLGTPGSGKGTQAKMISEKYSIPHISTGDIFREILSGTSGLAEEIRTIINSGRLVGDDIVFSVVKERLGRGDCSKGFLLDGFPRNIIQAKTFDGFLKNGTLRVIYLELSREVSIKRLTARRSCPKCRKGYNILSMPPAKDELCDVCNVQLVQRKDDNEETAHSRLDVYEKETSPLIEYYSKDKRLLRVNADTTVEDVFKNICSLL